MILARLTSDASELGPDEAESLLERIRNDPDLDRELRSFERILAAAGRGSSPTPGFTDRVMADVRAGSGGVASRPSLWIRALAAAAMVVVVFGTGWLLGRSGPLGPAAAPEDSPLALRLDRPGVTPASALEDDGRMHLVRLVYLPRGAGAEQVAVAGSFNGWNPEQAPMRREGDVWVTALVLPPGVHEYMFVVDGTRWVSDPQASEQRDDGFGNANSVLDLTL